MKIQNQIEIKLDKKEIEDAIIDYIKHLGYRPVTRPSFNIDQIPNNIEPYLYDLKSAIIDIEASPSITK